MENSFASLPQKRRIFRNLKVNHIVLPCVWALLSVISLMPPISSSFDDWHPKEVDEGWALLELASVRSRTLWIDHMHIWIKLKTLQEIGARRLQEDVAMCMTPRTISQMHNRHRANSFGKVDKYETSSNIRMSSVKHFGGWNNNSISQIVPSLLGRRASVAPHIFLANLQAQGQTWKRESNFSFK